MIQLKIIIKLKIYQRIYDSIKIRFILGMKVEVIESSVKQESKHNYRSISIEKNLKVDNLEAVNKSN